MSKQPMPPLTLSAYMLVTANGCSVIAVLAVVCRDYRGGRGRGHV